jgi:hypothetical protein
MGERAGILNLDSYVKPTIAIDTPDLRLTASNTFNIGAIVLNASDVFRQRNVFVVVNRHNPDWNIQTQLHSGYVNIGVTDMGLLNIPSFNRLFSANEYIEILVFESSVNQQLGLPRPDRRGLISQQIVHPALFQF